MKITKLEHSGLILEKNHDLLLIDPVEFTNKLPAFERVVAIVITHKHNDHCQPEVINRILAANPTAPVFTTPDTTPLISGSILVHPGETREVGGFRLAFFGKSHAKIIEDQIPCDNLGVVVDNLFANPGDSFDIPPLEHPKVLCVPISAPWCKSSDSINYVKKVRPEIVIPVHDAVLSKLGNTFNTSWLKFACDPLGIQLTSLTPGTSIEIGEG